MNIHLDQRNNRGNINQHFHFNICGLDMSKLENQVIALTVIIQTVAVARLVFFSLPLAWLITFTTANVLANSIIYATIKTALKIRKHPH